MFALKDKNKSLTELYLNKYKLVYSYIFDYTNEKMVADDISSAVWLKVMKSPERFLSMEKKELNNYLHVMVKSAAFDYFSQENKEKTKIHHAEILLSDESELLNSIESELFFENEYSILKKAIESLNEKEKELIILRFKEKLNWKEIAALYNVSEGALRTRQSRIYDKLRNEIFRIRKG